MSGRRCVNCMKQTEDKEIICPYCGYDQREQSELDFSMKPNSILQGRYLIGRILGQGGFGITYVGYDLKLDIKVAIKEYYPMGCVTRSHTVSNTVKWNTMQFSREDVEQGCEGFLKESRRMARIDSLPGIVRVRDTFTENQTAYIVMDFVEGENLKQRLLRAGVMRFDDCLALFWPLMESIDKMHKKEMIHRDISPDNIMIKPDGSACLLDFGAAKDVSMQRNAASKQVAKDGFSPPEQYSERGLIGPWTDVYALCATIYYCVTGKTVPNAMDRMNDQSLAFGKALDGVMDEKCARVIMDGLAFNLSERIQTVEELLNRLKKAAPFVPPVPPEPIVNKKAIGIAAGAAAAVVIAAVAWFAWPKASESSETANETAEVQSTVEETQSAEVEKAATAFANTLMKVDAVEGDDGEKKGTVLGSEISRDSVKSVTFLDTLADMPDTAWDASWGQDESVMAWAVECADDSAKYDIFIAADGVIKAKDCSYLFAGYYNVEKIDFGDCFDTSEVTDMQSMFYECSSLKAIDVSGLNTSKVENMRWMFYGCGALTSLDLSGFDTGRAANMKSMFCGCASLTSLDISGFDTKNVTDMSYMFKGCEELNALAVSGFDTGKVTNMMSMFESCKKLISLDVSGFDTKNVTDMGWMFYGCERLAALEVDGFDTGRVASMKNMFYKCKNLNSLDISGFATKNVTDMSWMFYECSSLKYLNADGFDVSAKADTTGMFDECAIPAKDVGIDLDKNVLIKENTAKEAEDGTWKGTVLGSDISRDSISAVTFLSALDGMPDTAWDVSWAQDQSVMAWTEESASGEGMHDLYIGAEGGVRARDCSWLFAGYYNMERIDFNHSFYTNSATDMQVMFYHCEKLTDLDVSGFGTDHVENMLFMFSDCVSLVSLDVSGFNTENVTDMKNMFMKCGKLVSLDVSGFDTSNVTDMSSMFYGCSGLTSLDVSGFDTSNVTGMSSMFYGCSGLTSLDVSGFDTSNVTDMSYMFYNCSSLTSLDVSSFDTGSAANTEGMFENCAITAEEAGLQANLPSSMEDAMNALSEEISEQVKKANIRLD